MQLEHNTVNLMTMDYSIQASSFFAQLLDKKTGTGKAGSRSIILLDDNARGRSRHHMHRIKESPTTTSTATRESRSCRERREQVVTGCRWGENAVGSTSPPRIPSREAKKVSFMANSSVKQNRRLPHVVTSMSA